MEKILISACLVGDKTRYDGKSNYNPLIQKLLEKFELVPVCPEIEGGLSVPRLPCERVNSKVINSKGKDVTKNFESGAERTYNICLYLGIKIAIFKEYSPSCGVNEISNGTFTHTHIKGKGVTAEYLERKGIKIYTENEIEEFLSSLDKKEEIIDNDNKNPNDN